MSSKTTASPLEALSAHGQAARNLSKLRAAGATSYEIYRAEDLLRKWFDIYTDPHGKGARYFRKVKP